MVAKFGSYKHVYFVLLALLWQGCSGAPGLAQQKPSWMQLRDFGPHKKNSSQNQNQQAAPKAAAPKTPSVPKRAVTPVNTQGSVVRPKGKQLVDDPHTDMWLDMSAAANLNFPVPLYQGKQVRVMNVNGQFTSVSMYGKQVVLQTRDDASEVYRWYKQMLPNAGFVVNDHYPAKALFGQSYMVRGDSSKEQAMVSINPQYDDKGPCTHIQVSVSPKHGVATQN